MSRREFEWWCEFYRLFPFDDLHRFHRPAAMIAAAFGGELQKRLEFLQPDPSTADLGEVDMQALRAFGFKK